MKRIFSLIICIIICGVTFAGCTAVGQTQESPDEVSDVKWTTYDYSFQFDTSDGCKGSYKYNDDTYDVTVEFESSNVSVIDNETDKVLWDGIWQYKDDNLYIHSISYNTEDFEEFEDSYTEFMDLKQEEISN